MGAVLVEEGAQDARSPCKISYIMSLFLDKTQEIKATKGILPHWHQECKLQFITFRLADSLPQALLKELEAKKELWLKQHPQPWSKESEKEYHVKFSQRIDKWLDASYGSCELRRPEVADIVVRTLDYFENIRYVKHGYVIMSNHFHALIELLPGFTVQQIMHSWKSYSANEINKVIGASGKFWARESFDRIIRDEYHYNNVKRYIVKNIKQGGVRWEI